MIDQHLGRRSVSDFLRGVLALRKKEIVAERQARMSAATAPAELQAAADAPVALNSREAVAKAARISSSQVVMIEKIRKQAAPELVAAVKSGTISINAAAAVASLPAEEQVAAAAAGKSELKQAAKRVREARRKPREESAALDESEKPELVRQLKLRVAELTAENESLRRQVADLLQAQQMA
jgi:hypothetical protein